MEDIKEDFESGKLVLGTKRVLKLLRKNKIKKVYLSSSAPGYIKPLLGDVKIVKLNMNALELGKYLGRSFPVSVCGVENESV